MAGEMNNVLEATLSILQGNRQEWSFSDLARCVIRQAHVDEATAKAAILRLNSEGHVEITPHWSVRLPQRGLEVVAA
jgi:Mn-dependent DtxR family transcriptional regulator